MIFESVTMILLGEFIRLFKSIEMQRKTACRYFATRYGSDRTFYSLYTILFSVYVFPSGNWIASSNANITIPPDVASCFIPYYAVKIAQVVSTICAIAFK